jgi:hypothetical protein
MPSTLEAPEPFLSTLRALTSGKQEFIATPEEQQDVETLLSRAGTGGADVSQEENSVLGTEMVTEAEAEAQRQQEAEQARQSQIAYDRGDEQQNPWPVSNLTNPSGGRTFYPINTFRVAGCTASIQAPTYVV